MKKKILLYLSSNSTFYTNLYNQIKEGFEEAGFEVIGDYTLLQDEDLLKKIDEVKPYFVFEMNRSKNEIRNFPKEVIHICWLVDFWGRKHNEIEGSDILYCWTENWIKDFQKKSNNKKILFLPPATSKKHYFPLKNIKKTNDFLFLGHIPKQWKKMELQREVGYFKNKKILFKDLLPIIKNHCLNKEIELSLHDYLEKKNIVLEKNLHNSIEYDISSRAYRQIRRKNFIKLFTKNSEFKTVIYGTENWKDYKSFKNNYKNFLINPIEINKELSKSNILLHDGNYPHFRTFDAMAAKCCVATCEVPLLYEKSWENLGFEANIDFIKINLFSNNIDFKILKDNKLLNSIRENAYLKTLKNHLWVNRAEKILNDIKELKNVNY